MENLGLYNATRAVPEDAVKQISGGRLKGMSDINPMWRIKTLTEQFGPCGIGWKYIIRKKRLEPSPTGEIAAFLDIDLYYKWDGVWSEVVPGTGGSSFVAKERNGSYTSDECFKMALTDAISVACKMLGMGADIYWQRDKSKYSTPNSPSHPMPSQNPSNPFKKDGFMTEEKAKELYVAGSKIGYSEAQINGMLLKRYNKRVFELNQKEFTKAYTSLIALSSEKADSGK